MNKCKAIHYIGSGYFSTLTKHFPKFSDFVWNIVYYLVFTKRTNSDSIVSLHLNFFDKNKFDWFHKKFKKHLDSKVPSMQNLNAHINDCMEFNFSDLDWEAMGQKLNLRQKEQQKRKFDLIIYVKWDMKCNNELSPVHMQTEANWLLNGEQRKHYRKTFLWEIWITRNVIRHTNCQNTEWYMQYADAHHRKQE